MCPRHADGLPLSSRGKHCTPCWCFGMRSSVSGCNMNLPPKMEQPMSAKTMMISPRSSTNSRIWRTVSMIAFSNIFMLCTFLANLKIRSSRKARRAETAPPLVMKSSTMEATTMMPSETVALFVQYALGPTATW